MPNIDLSFDTIVAQRMTFSGESREEAAQFVTNYVHSYMAERRAAGKQLNAAMTQHTHEVVSAADRPEHKCYF